jgi:hypothetical protein
LSENGSHAVLRILAEGAEVKVGLGNQVAYGPKDHPHVDGRAARVLISYTRSTSMVSNGSAARFEDNDDIGLTS